MPSASTARRCRERGARASTSARRPSSQLRARSGPSAFTGRSAIRRPTADTTRGLAEPGARQRRPALGGGSDLPRVEGIGGQPRGVERRRSCPGRAGRPQPRSPTTSAATSGLDVQQLRCGPQVAHAETTGPERAPAGGCPSGRGAARCVVPARRRRRRRPCPPVPGPGPPWPAQGAGRRPRSGSSSRSSSPAATTGRSGTPHTRAMVRRRRRAASRASGAAAHDVGVVAPDERLQDGQLEGVELVERAEHRRPHDDPGGELGRVVRSRRGQVGPGLEQGPQLLVGPAAQLVGEGARARGRRGAGGGHPHNPTD